jgi:biuret amidohydrolase
MDDSLLEPTLASGRAALLICDMQNDYVKPAHNPAPSLPAVLANTARLLAAARQHRVPVAYTRGLYRRDGLHSSPVHKLWLGGRAGMCWEGTPGAEIVDELRPNPGDIMIDTIRYSAFFHSPLETLLRGLGVSHLFLAGVSTHWGVEASARDAEQCDFIPIVVADACGSSEEEMHQASLRTIDAFVGFVVPTERALALLARR